MEKKLKSQTKEQISARQKAILKADIERYASQLIAQEFNGKIDQNLDGKTDFVYRDTEVSYDPDVFHKTLLAVLNKKESYREKVREYELAYEAKLEQLALLRVENMLTEREFAERFTQERTIFEQNCQRLYEMRFRCDALDNEVKSAMKKEVTPRETPLKLTKIQSPSDTRIKFGETILINGEPANGDDPGRGQGGKRLSYQLICHILGVDGYENMEIEELERAANEAAFCGINKGKILDKACELAIENFDYPRRDARARENLWAGVRKNFEEASLAKSVLCICSFLVGAAAKYAVDKPNVTERLEPEILEYCTEKSSELNAKYGTNFTPTTDLVDQVKEVYWDSFAGSGHDIVVRPGWEGFYIDYRRSQGFGIDSTINGMIFDATDWLGVALCGAAGAGLSASIIAGLCFAPAISYSLNERACTRQIKALRAELTTEAKAIKSSLLDSFTPHLNPSAQTKTYDRYSDDAKIEDITYHVYFDEVPRQESARYRD